MNPTSASLRLTADAKDIWPDKPCQRRRIGNAEWEDLTVRWSLITNLDQYEYRPTPALKFRPWTAEEVPLGGYVKNDVNGNKRVITAVDSTDVWLGGIGGVSFERLFVNYTQLDGQPCGTEDAAKEKTK